MHPLFQKADDLSRQVIGAAIEFHRLKGPGLIESIYERCLLREPGRGNSLTEENEGNEGGGRSPIYEAIYGWPENPVNICA